MKKDRGLVIMNTTPSSREGEKKRVWGGKVTMDLPDGSLSQAINKLNLSIFNSKII